MSLSSSAFISQSNSGMATPYEPDRAILDRWESEAPSDGMDEAASNAESIYSTSTQPLFSPERSRAFSVAAVDAPADPTPPSLLPSSPPRPYTATSSSPQFGSTTSNTAASSKRAGSYNLPSQNVNNPAVKAYLSTKSQPGGSQQQIAPFLRNASASSPFNFDHNSDSDSDSDLEGYFDWKQKKKTQEGGQPQPPSRRALKDARRAYLSSLATPATGPALNHGSDKDFKNGASYKGTSYQSEGAVKQSGWFSDEEITEDEEIALAIQASLETLPSDDLAVANMMAHSVVHEYCEKDSAAYDPNAECEPSKEAKFQELVRTAYFADELEKLHVERVIEGQYRSRLPGEGIPSNVTWGNVAPAAQVLSTYLAMKALDPTPARDLDLPVARTRAIEVMRTLSSTYPIFRSESDGPDEFTIPVPAPLDSPDDQVEAEVKLWLRTIKEKTDLMRTAGERLKARTWMAVNEDEGVDILTEKFTLTRINATSHEERAPDKCVLAKPAQTENTTGSENTTENRESDTLTSDDLFEDDFTSEGDSDGDNTETEGVDTETEGGSEGWTSIDKE